MSAVAERIDFLINNLREDQEVEIKNWLNCLANRADQAKLAKEIIALANHGGGYVFVGFEDEEPHPSIEAPDGWKDAFSQDSIAGVIERYVTPPCQCEVHILTREGEEAEHPVIVVPGDHRTPLFANRGSPEGAEAFERTDVFVRRPGGKSQRASTQDDWEKLINRLVRARRDEMLAAVRGVLDPEGELIAEDPGINIGPWVEQSHARWNHLLDEGLVDLDDYRRFNEGWWHVAFAISGFEVDGLNILSTHLDREMSKFSGWPPFTFLHVDQRAPYPFEDTIEAWIGADSEAANADFWRVSKNGYGFMLRPFSEDEGDFGINRNPRPPLPAFSWTHSIYKMTEVFLYIENLGYEFADTESVFELQVHYHGTEGRSLFQHSYQYTLREGATCRANHLTNSIITEIGDISSNLNELVYTLLKPIYAQFEFTELPKVLVDNVIKTVLANQVR